MNAKELRDANRQIRAVYPLCADRIILHLRWIRLHTAYNHGRMSVPRYFNLAKELAREYMGNRRL